MQLHLSLFATALLSRAATVPAQETSDHLNFDAYGTTLQLPVASEVEYDQTQNGGGSAPTFPDEDTLHVSGNRWSAYPIATEVYEDSVLQFTFALHEATHAGFQAICLDADLELTGKNGQCIVLSSSQGWLDDMLNANKMTNVNATTQHSIPIGHFFTGPVNYLVFLQDSDGSASDKRLGDSSVSGLRLVRRSRIGLKMNIAGVDEELANHQLNYKFNGKTQDTTDWLIHINEDGAGVQINGNQWKALALNAPYNITHTTLLEFDIVVNDPGDVHAICLDANTDVVTNGKECITLLSHPDKLHYTLTTQLEVGVVQHMIIPVGMIRGLVGGEHQVVNYVAFVQDNDVGDKRGGMSTFSNLRLYEEDRTPLKFQLHNATVAVPNIQDSFTSSSGSAVQDSLDHIQSVSPDGRKVTVYGNSWKRYKLDAPFDVGHATMARFTFEVPVEAEFFLFCLLRDTDNQHDGRNDCWAPGGKDVPGGGFSFPALSPLTRQGETNEYEINIGSYFQGPVYYLAFGQDNDAGHLETRAEGEGSVSNIEIYNLPSLKIGLDAGSFAIPNEQQFYESSAQDNTPIRDNLAVVSDDGASITLRGNMWRSLPLQPPLPAAALGDFVVSFDYLLTTPGEIHAICFEDNKLQGDYDNPSENRYDPKRCILLNLFQEESNLVWWNGYMTAVGEPHRFVFNLSKMPIERFYSWSYLALVQDSDADKSVGEMKVSNLHVTTSLTSCLKEVDHAFQLDDCTIGHFLAGVESKMAENAAACGANPDPLLELMAHFDARDEMQVYKKIERICSASYDASGYDFEKAISSEPQVVREFIDGGTFLNYERDSEGSNLAKDGAGIGFADQYTSDHLLSFPQHHALDQCDVGAAMCCWVTSRGASALAANSDVCYVDMKASRLTAHVKDGYSVYGDTAGGGNAHCRGFAWGTDGGSVHGALKGNALFKVGFADHLYAGLTGHVEQVPGAPMCGCIDRMPVVTQAACTKVTDATSTVDVAYNKAIGAYHAKYNMGTIEYADCGSDLKDYYKTLVGADSHHAAYMDTRIVGDGKCHGAINVFLEGKGLIKTA